jgi:paraquat-inducible protein B
MSTPTNQWKLGLFVVMGLALLVGAIVFFGARSLRTETVEYKTYFDESVQGLDPGAPVKYRGVTIGGVYTIDVAQDRRHVEITIKLDVKELENMRLVEKGPGIGTRIAMPPDMRAQLGSTGITGVKFVQLDFFSVKDNPLPSLPFPVPANYIPAAPSMMTKLEESVVKAVNSFPELAAQLVTLLARVNHILEEVEGQGLPEKTAIVLKQSSALLADISTRVSQLDVGAMSTQAKETLANLNAATVKMDRLMDKVAGDKGLFASAQRTSDAVGELARDSSGVGRELETTLHEVQQAAASIRKLADALERDPDMLIKGRAVRRAP